MHEDLPVEERPQDDEKNQPDGIFFTKRDLIRIGKVALILSISLLLPGYLYIAGLKLGWALGLFAGFIAVGLLGFSIKR